MSGKVGFTSPGCPKALVNSKRILTQLRTEGYEVTSRYDDADMLYLNQENDLKTSQRLIA